MSELTMGYFDNFTVVHLQVDIDPYNPDMGSFLGHAGDVILNTLSASDTDYNSVALSLGVLGTRIMGCF